MPFFSWKNSSKYCVFIAQRGQKGICCKDMNRSVYLAWTHHIPSGSKNLNHHTLKCWRDWPHSNSYFFFNFTRKVCVCVGGGRMDGGWLLLSVLWKSIFNGLSERWSNFCPLFKVREFLFRGTDLLALVEKQSLPYCLSIIQLGLTVFLCRNINKHLRNMLEVYSHCIWVEALFNCATYFLMFLLFCPYFIKWE